MSFLFAAATPVVAGELGVNYNGVLSQIQGGDLLRTKAKWIRGFVDYYDFKTGKKNLRKDAGLRKLHWAHENGYKIILNLKFDLSKRDFPATQAGIDRELSYLPKLLSEVYLDCDTLVAGNEPFIESKISQRDSRLSNFYEAVATKVSGFSKGAQEQDSTLCWRIQQPMEANMADRCRR
jgi:hypothetical protein